MIATYRLESPQDYLVIEIDFSDVDKWKVTTLDSTHEEMIGGWTAFSDGKGSTFDPVTGLVYEHPPSSVPGYREILAPGVPFYNPQVLARLSGEPSQTLLAAAEALSVELAIERADESSVTLAGGGSVVVYDRSTGIPLSMTETQGGKVVREVTLLDVKSK
jgi:hypothetical protein